MKNCYVCERPTKYSCIKCSNAICNVCAESVDPDIVGYDEDNYRIGQCPLGKCQKKISDSTSNSSEKELRKGFAKKTSSTEKLHGKVDKQKTLENFFSKPNFRKRKTQEDSHKEKDSQKETERPKKAKVDGETKSVQDASPDTSDVSSKPTPTKVDEFEDQKNEIFSSFQKVFNDIEESQIHNYYFCSGRKCDQICQEDLKSMNKDNKFQHKWLFDPNIAKCNKTDIWCLVYIEGKGMFCSLCRNYNITQNNGKPIWNTLPNIRCRTQTVTDHYSKETSMHQEAVQASMRHKSSYFDKAKKEKISTLKNEVYYKVFSTLYWLAKEEMPSSKITSLLTLIEKMGVKELRYFETRSEVVLRKMLLLISKTIVQDLVAKIKASQYYALLTDEVTDISNLCQLVSFVKIFDEEGGKADTRYLDCSDLLEHSPEASPDADAIVACITEKFKELTLEIENLKAFVSDGASVMTGVKGGVAAKLRNEFTATMINVHCVCHRLALACADTGDDYKFINSLEETLLNLWKFFKNSPKRLKIYIRIALSCKDFDKMTKKGQKKMVKRLKKACRTRWLSLHAGVDAVFEEYVGIVKTLQELQNDKKSGALATGLLKKVQAPEFIGTLYLLKHMLPSLSALSKTFQKGSLNFSRITPSINRCKAKISEIESKGIIWEELEKDLAGRLKPLNVSMTDSQEKRVKSLPGKYVKSMCENIDARFPANSCEVLNAFSIFDVELLPAQNSPAFIVYGNDEVRTLKKQFFPDEAEKPILEQWADFKYEMVEMKKKLSTLRAQLQLNEIKFKQTSTEWTLEYVLNSFKDDVTFPFMIKFAKLAAIVPITNAWPERGASAVKRIKSRQRSTMKNDLLNGLLHISLNGPPVGSPEAENLLNRVVDKYCEEKHNKKPTLYGPREKTQTIATQTQVVNVPIEDDEVQDVTEKLERDEQEFIITNFESDSDDSENDELLTDSDDENV